MSFEGALLFMLTLFLNFCVVFFGSILVIAPTFAVLRRVGLYKPVHPDNAEHKLTNLVGLVAIGCAIYGGSQVDTRSRASSTMYECRMKDDHWSFPIVLGRKCDSLRRKTWLDL